MDNNPLIIDTSSISSDEENQFDNIGSNESYNKKNQNKQNISGESDQTYITIFGRNSSTSPDERSNNKDERTCLGKTFEYCCINSKIFPSVCNPAYWIGTSVFIGIVLIIWIIIDAALK